MSWLDAALHETTGDVLGLSRKVTLVYLEDCASCARVRRVRARIEQATHEDDFLGLKEVTSRIVALDDLRSILDVILQQVLGGVAASRGFIALTDESGQIQREATVTVGVEVDHRGRPTGFSRSVLDRVIRQRRRLFLMRRHDLDPDALSASVVALNLRAVMCAPLILDERLLGLLYVDASSYLTDFDEMAQLSFMLLADHAAVAIGNARTDPPKDPSAQRPQRQPVEAESQYEQMVRLSPDAVMVQTSDQVLFANPAAHTLLGLPYGQGEGPTDRAGPLVGADPLSFVHTSSHAQFGSLPQGEGAAFRIEDARFAAHDGKPIAVDVVGVPLVFRGESAVMLVARDGDRRS